MTPQRGSIPYGRVAPISCTSQTVVILSIGNRKGSALNRQRLILAFLISPLATPVAISAVFACRVVSGMWSSEEGYLMVRRDVLTLAIVATPIAYVFAFIGAILALTLFRKKGWLRIIHFILLGVCLGMLPFIFLDLWIILLGAISADLPILDVIRTSTGAYLWIPLGVICGVSTAVSFWLLGIRQIQQRG